MNLPDTATTDNTPLRVVAVDDEPLALELLVRTIKSVRPHAQIMAFAKPEKAMAYVRDNPVDVAFLDIQMRGLSGVELAEALRSQNPAVNLIFVTGYDQYTGDAMALHASGYILKPVNKAKIEKELSDLRYPRVPALLRVRCLGNFDVFAPNGQTLHFSRSKAKEAFAYLVYRSGAACTVRELAAVLFEDEPYDTKKCQYMQKILSSMMEALQDAGANGVVSKRYNSIAVNTELLDCDYYRLMKSDPEAMRSYNGEFMTQYSWAERETGALENFVQQKSHAPETGR